MNEIVHELLREIGTELGGMDFGHTGDEMDELAADFMENYVSMRYG